MMDTVKNLTRCRRMVSRTLLAACTSILALWITVAAPVAAQEVEIETDARLEGFNGTVKVENDSTALMWLFFLFLTVIALSPLFKDAKRTHLD
jgi:hypothetical protein